MIRAASITGILAIGMSYITISGNLFALSAEELAILSACVFAVLMRAEYDLATSLVLTLLFAAACGAIQGGIISFGRRSDHHHAGLWRLVSRRRLPGQQQSEHPARHQGGAMARHGPPARHPDAELGLRLPDDHRVVRPPEDALRTAAFVDRRQSGRGGDRLRVGQAALIALTIFGVCCGMAGISAASQFGLAVANLFAGLNIDVVAAVLVGGISLRGGQGSPIQAALGAIFIALLQNFMLLHSFTSGQRMLVVGCLVAIATLGFHLVQRRRA